MQPFGWCELAGEKSDYLSVSCCFSSRNSGIRPFLAQSGYGRSFVLSESQLVNALFGGCDQIGPKWAFDEAVADG